jgi:uncharacterized RDD family membrane protein YckC
LQQVKNSGRAIGPIILSPQSASPTSVTTLPPPPDAPAFGATPALTRRMACWLYEGMLLFGVVFIAGYLFSSLTQTKNALDNRHALQAFVFVVFGIYFVWFWSKGQTLAMKTWHIRVVAADGQSLTQSRALKRYLLSWLWFLPSLTVSWLFALPAPETLVLVPGWVAIWAVLSRFHPTQQFWHDAWAGTRLVNTKAA